MVNALEAIERAVGDVLAVKKQNVWRGYDLRPTAESRKFVRVSVGWADEALVSLVEPEHQQRGDLSLARLEITVGHDPTLAADLISSAALRLLDWIREEEHEDNVHAAIAAEEQRIAEDPTLP